ncbi:MULTISPECIES: TSUP family transporter [unclassified Nostoc]|uniref:TSUP family transporter n=1 Tax=unclassified Nostoc TaxID=2593658 RepID=UPI001D9CEE4D|nr:TSUP family transporter [Nostoc sp. JL23]MBN3876174.1 MFS transporter [Nostoc sp. JL23]
MPPSLTLFHSLLLFSTAFIAGGLNAVAGGGSFITFPTLIFTGVPPIAANATNNTAIWVAALASAGAYRQDLGIERRDFLLLCGVSLVGGMIGSIALLYTSPDVFKKLIPYLLLLATVVFTFGEPFKKWLQRRNQNTSPESVPLFNLALAQLAIAIYGGFFGAGIGILMLAALTFLGISGIIADRWNRHQILLVAQILGMLQSLALTWLALSGTINIEYIAILGVLQGIINAFDIPTRQAFLPETVSKENLGNAFALYSSLVSVTSMVGPAIAGLLIVALGSGLCFLIDSISYIAVIIALLAIRLTSRKAIISKRKPLEELKTSFKYAFGFLPIRSVLIGSALVCCVWGFYLALGPIFAKEILQGGPNTFGFLMTASSLGTLAGGIYLTKHSNVLESGKVLALGICFMGISLIVFALSRVFWLSLLSLFAAGFGFILQIIAGRTLLQLLVSDENRGCNKR